MPSLATTVAALDIPVVAGAQDVAITDPVIDGLLSYLGTWIKSSLDAKLATMTRRPVADACPVANRHAVNPSSLVSRVTLPALFIWQESSVVKSRTMVLDGRTRKLRVMYVFERAQALENLEEWRGLINAVDAIFARAISRGAHPSFANETHIAIHLNLVSIEYQGGVEGFLAEFAAGSIRDAAHTANSRRVGALKNSANAIQAGYPSLLGTIVVLEPIGQDTAVDPGDLLPDLAVSAAVNEQGDVADGLVTMTRVVPAPPYEETT